MAVRYILSQGGVYLVCDHYCGPGGLGRLDFERGAVAGEVIYTVEGD